MPRKTEKIITQEDIEMRRAYSKPAKPKIALRKTITYLFVSEDEYERRVANGTNNVTEAEAIALGYV